MNNIDEMPSKCHNCPYWEIAKTPYVCMECERVYFGINDKDKTERG